LSIKYGDDIFISHLDWPYHYGSFLFGDSRAKNSLNINSFNFSLPTSQNKEGVYGIVPLIRLSKSIVI
jgi:hypothetical protein